MRHRKSGADVFDLARQIVSGEVGVLEGSPSLAGFRSKVDETTVALLEPFFRIAESSAYLILGFDRVLYHEQRLIAQEPQVAQQEALWRDVAIDASETLIQAFGAEYASILRQPVPDFIDKFHAAVDQNFAFLQECGFHLERRRSMGRRGAEVVYSSSTSTLIIHWDRHRGTSYSGRLDLVLNDHTLWPMLDADRTLLSYPIGIQLLIRDRTYKPQVLTTVASFMKRNPDVLMKAPYCSSRAGG